MLTYSKRSFSLHIFSQKIKVKGDIVELEGDEMAQVLWNSVKQQVCISLF